MAEVARQKAKLFQEHIGSVLRDGLARSDALDSGQAFLDLSAGINQAGGFARGELGARLSDAVTGFGFGQVQDDFQTGRIEFEAGAGLRFRW